MIDTSVLCAGVSSTYKVQIPQINTGMMRYYLVEYAFKLKHWKGRKVLFVGHNNSYSIYGNMAVQNKVVDYEIVFSYNNKEYGVFCEGKSLFTFNEANKPETEIEFSNIDELLGIDVQGKSLCEIITEVEVLHRNV